MEKEHSQEVYEGTAQDIINDYRVRDIESAKERIKWAIDNLDVVKFKRIFDEQKDIVKEQDRNVTIVLPIADRDNNKQYTDIILYTIQIQLKGSDDSKRYLFRRMVVQDGQLIITGDTISSYRKIYNVPLNNVANFIIG